MGEGTSQYQSAVALVTGASGFIGGHLVRYLAGLGATVHCTTRRSADQPNWHTIDLSDRPAVKSLISDIQPDYVFHLASHVTGSRDASEIEATFDGNLLSTVNLLSAIRETKCRRFVLAGSLEEPDANESVPSSPYAASKSAASAYAKMFWNLYQTPITIARLFMVYGPDQPDTRKLVPYVTLSLLKGESPQLSSGARPVDWVHVNDVAETLARSAIAPELLGQTIDVGTGQLTTVRSVAERISSIVGKGKPIFGSVEDRSQEQIRAANPETAESLLGRRMMSVEQGLENTVQWYREKNSR